MLTENKLTKFGFEDITQYFVWIMELVTYGEQPPTPEDLIQQLNKGQKKDFLAWLDGEDERLIPTSVNYCKKLIYKQF